MSEQTYILALDQGTTSSRAIVFDHAGTPVSAAQREFTQHYPKPGWVEHDPGEIWESQQSVAIQALEEAGLTARDIAAVGVANQRETTLVWDRETGEPVCNAIVWQDRRTARTCRQLKQAGHAELFHEKTGLFLDPYFSGTKVAWILDNVAGVRERAEAGKLAFGTVDSWLTWNLTGGAIHVTDVTNASRTLLYNIHELQWDNELLEIMDIPPSLLPEVKPSSGIIGEISAGSVLSGIPLAGIAGDQQAALFGQACFEVGMAKNTYGTGCFLLMNTGSQPVNSTHNLLTTIAWQVGDEVEYALEGSVFNGGAVVQWLRDELKLVSSAQECDQLAATVADSNGLYLVPAFTGLGAPYWDPNATGAAFGINRGTNRAHLCRAALESIGFQVADLAQAQLDDLGQPLKQLRVDGGAACSDPLMQFQADLLQCDVIRPQCIETTALGAAYLAGLAVGYWTGKEDITRNWKRGACFTPGQSVEDMLSHRKGWSRAVARSLKWGD